MRDPIIRQVWARLGVVGFHRWGADFAPAHLAVTHRHQFDITVRLSVDHDDREVEFHQLQGVIGRSLKALPRMDVDSTGAPIEGINFVGMSCEQIAAMVAGAVDEQWPGRRLTVEVSEDGECGAVVVWDRER